MEIGVDCPIFSVNHWVNMLSVTLGRRLWLGLWLCSAGSVILGSGRRFGNLASEMWSYGWLNLWTSPVLRSARQLGTSPILQLARQLGTYSYPAVSPSSVELLPFCRQPVARHLRLPALQLRCKFCAQTAQSHSSPVQELPEWRLDFDRRMRPFLDPAIITIPSGSRM